MTVTEPPLWLGSIGFFLVDLDGVILIGKEPLHGSSEAIKRLRQHGARVLFSTNNSSKSKSMVVEELRLAEIDATSVDIICSADITARFMVHLGIRNAFVVGEHGLIEELSKSGVKVLDESSKIAEAVVVGIDRDLTYSKLARAALLIRSGSKFIVTNMDSTYPSPEGEIPGGGSIAAALQTATEVKPDVIGKPNTFFVEEAIRLTGANKSKVAIIGDRPETDILMAKRAGCTSILVLSGIAKEHSRSSYTPELRPDLICRDLNELSLLYLKAKS